MKFLHSMIRVSDPDATVAFFQLLGLEERRRMDNEAGRFTLIFLGVPGDEGGEVELTYNWDESGYGGGRNFGHLAYQVDDIYETCQRLMDGGVTINRPPRDGRMAFVRTPDDISVELAAERRRRSLRPSPGRRCRTPANGDARDRRRSRPSPTIMSGWSTTRRAARRRWSTRAMPRPCSPRPQRARLAHHPGLEHALITGIIPAATSR